MQFRKVQYTPPPKYIPPFHVWDNVKRAYSIMQCPYSVNADIDIYDPIPTDDPAVSHVLVVLGCIIQESDPHFRHRVTVELDDHRLTVIMWTVRESDFDGEPDQDLLAYLAIADFSGELWQDHYRDTAALFSGVHCWNLPGVT